jgi:hypothetical protein
MTRSRCASRFTIVATLGLIVPSLASAGGALGGERPECLAGGFRPTQVNVTNDITRRYGEPEVAVNPRNPDNLVYMVMSENYTYDCQANHDPTCQPPIPGQAPIGLLTVPGFISAKVFVSFDRGQTWSNVKFPAYLLGDADRRSFSDPMVTATADGTFYIAWNDMHETLQRLNGNLDGGVAVSKSTDGGLTWSQPVLTGTPIDRPWLVSDLSTGAIYEASGEPPLFGLLGPGSTGDANAPLGTIADRWLAASWLGRTGDLAR